MQIHLGPGVWWRIKVRSVNILCLNTWPANTLQSSVWLDFFLWLCGQHVYFFISLSDCQVTKVFYQVGPGNLIRCLNHLCWLEATSYIADNSFHSDSQYLHFLAANLHAITYPLEKLHFSMWYSKVHEALTHDTWLHCLLWPHVYDGIDFRIQTNTNSEIKYNQLKWKLSNHWKLVESISRTFGSGWM